MKPIILIVACAMLWTGCARDHVGHEHASDSGAHEAHAAETRGPHGGRLLESGELALELAIFESAVPPELHAWLTRAGRPVPPAEYDLSIELHRLGGTIDRVSFTPAGEFLRSDIEVREPHSFDAKVVLTYDGQTHRWEYASYEGRTRIPEDVAQSAGIETAIAGPGVLQETLSLYGTIAPDPARVREVKARFPGIIRSVTGRIGSRVERGAELATVESNESLRTYTITAPLAGIITQRHAEPGEQTGDEPLFVIADFSRVVADFRVFPRDRARIRAGQRVTITAEGAPAAAGTISYVAPLGDRTSQSVTARVVLENAGGVWTPGQFVDAHVAIAETPVSLAVPLSAVQRFRDFDVVYAKYGDTYEIRPLELGRRDSQHVEVLAGLDPGTPYVTQNSYLIKADIEKSGASHDH
jgi:cobalt-zinc-cadmium efflux system membrane fusion protein